MKVKYVGPFDGVFVPEIGAFVDNGKTIEVPEKLGKALLEQPDNWKKSTAPGKPASESQEDNG